MKKIRTITLAILLLTPLAALHAADAAERWTAAKANEWYAAQPWLVGCNFLPSTAVNDVEMWQAETFDAATIGRELGWAHDLGFNTVRVFLNYVVWEADADGLKKRFDRFLAIADKQGIRVMPILFDDCNFAGRTAAIGKQPDPVPGVHNSQWVSSPPLAMVADRAAWPKLEQYVKDMVGTFAQDRRVVIWDLYNEPGNSGMGEKSRPLMEAAFAWAHELKPTQPLTTGAFVNFNAPLSQRMMELSDIVSFHGYDDRKGIEAKLKICGGYGRPVLCTEWLLRQGGNNFESLLPLFRGRKIGCYNWGLVAGRMQTYFHWGSKPGTPEPALWQHDILRKDGTPFNAQEVQFIKVTTGRLAASTYTNPVGAPPVHMGDPFAFEHGGKYYLIGTTSPGEGFQCYESTNLVDWQLKGWAWRKTANSWAVGAFWAPEVKFYQGKFYLTYSGQARDSHKLLMGLAVSDAPSGPYRDLHTPWFDPGYSTIDGDIFVDDDGTPYLTFSRNGSQDGYGYGMIYGVQLERDLSKPVGEPVKLLEASQPWERINWARNRCNEGPTVIKHAGRYYMTYSANNTGWPGYGVGYATAKSPLGPWSKAEGNPILASHLEIGVSSPGHNSIVTTADGKEMFIVYHTHADPRNPSDNRVVNVDRLEFTADGKLRVIGPTRSPQPLPSAKLEPLAAPGDDPAQTGVFNINLSDIRVRDPFILADQASKTYYLYAQCGNRQNHDGLGLGVEVYTSKDLVTWSAPVLAFERPKSGFWGGSDIWAPEVHQFGKSYFMFVTFPGRKGGRGTQILRADRPEGPFRILGDTANTPPEQQCLDGTPWIDEDGTHWLVYCNEWSSIKDGTVRAVPMTDDWTARKGESLPLFHASEAPWVRPFRQDCFVTDGPFLHRTKDGKLLMIWSSFRKGGDYAVGVAESESGSVKGPWRHSPDVLFGKDGGHGMIFRNFSGDLLLSLHQPNGGTRERAHFFKLKEDGGRMELAATPEP